MLLPRHVSFWALALILGAFLFGASAPSPLYPDYARTFGFSSLTLTAIYAVFAFGGLATLLTTGRLSDHLGRRPVVSLALVVELAGMLVLEGASGVAALYVGRALTGLATGVAAGALSAWLLDLGPRSDPRLGGLIGGIAVLAGLGGGAIGSGLLVQFLPDPLHLVFWVLIAVYAIAFVAIMVMPDASPRRPGWVGSLRPVIGVPAAARSLFAALMPSLIAAWALGGLYLSLGPSLAIALVGPSRLAGGLVIFALLGTAMIVSLVTSRADPRVLVTRGTLVLIVGVAATLLAVALGSSIGLYAASVAAGAGFGPVFSAIYRSLAALAPASQRGALTAAIYAVVYPSFSIPAILAGAASSAYGLPDTTFAYGLIVMALAAMTTIALARQRPVPVAA